jgi:hypothetical protein
VDERTETVPETGENIRVTTARRGILGTESRTYNSFPAPADALCYKPSKEQLEKFCDSLRDELEVWGLPSDRQFSWIKIGDGDWQPCADDHRLSANMAPVSWSIWYSRLKALTEPLTKQRSAGDLLWALTELLNRPGIEPNLWHVSQCLTAFRRFGIAGAPNFFATAGIAARKGRAVGPTAKRQQAGGRREAIRPLVCKFWETSPIHRNDAANTAAALAVPINQVLRDQGLLPRAKKRLSVKTINDYIRELIRGKSI